MTAYLYEFTFRGRHPSEAPLPSDYHVRLGDQVTNFGQSQLVQSGPLTPAQAAALGFPLPTIVAAINTAIMADNAALREDVAARTKDQEDKAVAIKATKAELDRLSTEADAKDARIAELEAAAKAPDA